MILPVGEYEIPEAAQQRYKGELYMFFGSCPEVAVLVGENIVEIASIE